VGIEDIRSAVPVLRGSCIILRKSLYYKIYDTLRRRINSHELRPGDFLPTEAELGRFFNVSLAPVRQALSLLQNEGLIIRQPGKGTFVASLSEEMKLWLSLSPFRRHFQKYGNKVSCRTVKICKKAPPPEIREFFAFNGSWKVIYIERVRSVEGRPIIVNQLYISPLFDIQVFIDAGDFASTRALIFNKFSVEVTRIEDILTAVSASERFSDILEIPRNHPLLLLKRRSFAGETPVLVDMLHMITNTWDYRVTLEKSPIGKVFVAMD
jgi:GntR family transcriptional regulator